MDRRWSSLLLLLLVPIGGCQGSGAAPIKAATPHVEYHLPIVGTVTDFAEFPGSTEALVTVQVRARVTGYMTEVYFKDGNFVEKDAKLFQIDPRQYKAEWERAVGNVDQIEAHKKRLEKEYHRAKNLLAQRAISQEEHDRYESDYRETEAALKLAIANRDLAALNYEWTEVRAPSAGLLSRRLVDPGNLIKADDTVLTSIVTQDPMYVYFDVDEQSTLHVRRMIRDGKVKAKSEKEVPVMLGLSDEAPAFPHSGTVDFTDNRVDVNTGSLRFRAVVRNEKGLLTPGLFMRVRLPIGDPHPTLYVREEALASDQGRKIVYVITDEAATKSADAASPSPAGEGKPGPSADEVSGKIATREVKIGSLREGFRAIEKGLQAGEKVVLSGLQRIRPGVSVRATRSKLTQLPPEDVSFTPAPEVKYAGGAADRTYQRSRP
jgi:RND family efflux transporter MFP subunit